MEILENFAVFEGIDGSGTTTQLNILENFFLRNPDQLVLPPFYKTFEPTDGSIGRIIRAGLRKEAELSAETIAMLFAADRNEHIFGSGGVAERCKRGELVVSDRYVLSSLVYQGITCGDELPVSLNRLFPSPELLIFLDIDPEIAEKRIAHREIKEIYEFLDFQIQVRRRYKTLLSRFSADGARIEIIDASKPPEEVAREIWELIKKLPIFKR